jgi:parvulin-like peptidyl-prolyl isomerase
MHKMIFPLVIAAPFIWACGASFPPPTQRLADAQSAERSARELGAERVPAAKLSLKLSQQQIAQAKKAITEEENKVADGLLIRAKADAELAMAQTREKGARVDKQEAVEDSAEQKTTNAGQGAE